MDGFQAYFGVGKVYKAEKNMYRYMVQSLKDLRIIIDHFDKYSLITQKRADFELFKKAVEILSNKEHLTIEGIHKLIAIRASINLGLPPKLKAAFPQIVNYSPRYLVKDIEIKSPYWFSGFTSGFLPLTGAHFKNRKFYSTNIRQEKSETSLNLVL